MDWGVLKALCLWWRGAAASAANRGTGYMTSAGGDAVHGDHWLFRLPYIASPLLSVTAHGELCRYRHILPHRRQAVPAGKCVRLFRRRYFGHRHCVHLTTRRTHARRSHREAHQSILQ